MPLSHRTAARPQGRGKGQDLICPPPFWNLKKVALFSHKRATFSWAKVRIYFNIVIYRQINFPILLIFLFLRPDKG